MAGAYRQTLLQRIQGALELAVLVSQVTDFSLVDNDSSIKHDPRYAATQSIFTPSVADDFDAPSGASSCGPCGEKSGLAQQVI
jgi:hypothetical protein